MIDRVNEQNFEAQLVAFGLSETEATIYLCLLRGGPQTPLQLSRATNIDRSKIYRSVDKLISGGFLETTHAAWGKKLQAASPSNIERIIQTDEENLQARKAMLPELVSALSGIKSYVQREFEVKHYRGQEGLKQMLWNQLSAKSDIVAFSFGNKNDIAGKPYAEKVRTEHMHRGIVLYELENETDQGDYWYSDVATKDVAKWEQCYKSRHISPDLLKIEQYIAVYNNTVGIINWLGGEEVGIEIINSTFASTQRQLFWQVWELADPAPNERKS